MFILEGIGKGKQEGKEQREEFLIRGQREEEEGTGLIPLYISYL